MNNTIDTHRAGSSLPTARPTDSTGGAVAAPVATSASRDSVQLTANATRLAAIDRALSSAGDVDLQKVNAARDAIQSGNYLVDAAAVADKLLQFERLLAV